MNIVKDILVKPESKSLMPFNSKKKIAGAAKLFSTLEQLIDPAKCNKEGLKIIHENSISLDQRPCLDRVSGIFTHYLKQQEAVCSLIYPGLLKEKLARMEKLNLKRLDDFVQKAVYIDRKGENRVRDLYKEIRINNVKPSAENLHYALEHFFQARPYDKDVIDKSDPQNILKRIELKHLIEPCNHYCENLSDIFDVASTWLYFHETNSNEFEFYYSWAKYMFCNNALKMLNNDSSS